MKVKAPQHKVALEIDGKSFPSSLVQFLYQQDPFPAGHRYNLTISNVNTKKHCPLIEPGMYEHPDRSICSKAELSLNNLLEWLNYSEGGSSQIQFFLNSIETLSIADDEVIVDGVCSMINK